MTLAICSYNIRLGEAFDQAGEIAQKENLDVLCLQECKENQITERLGGLSLVGATQLDKVALALYYNPKTLRLEESTEKKLPAAWYERNRTHNRTRLQLVKFTVVNSGAHLIVGNFHLANLVAPNIDRRKQLQAALEIANGFRNTAPVVVVGDTNYPFFDGKVSKIVEKAGFREFGTATPGRTHANKLARKKFDRVFAAGNVAEIDYKIQPIAVSDHAAIVTRLKLKI